MTVWPFADGIDETIAGRSTPGTMPSTKRAVASSAPVFPALTQAAARAVAHQIHGDAHRRVFLLAYGVLRALVHADDFAGLHDLAPATGGTAAQQWLEVAGASDQEQPQVLVVREHVDGGRNRHARAMVAAHGVDCDGQRRRHRRRPS